MITIGHSYELEVVDVVEFGVYLDAGRLGDVLLPRQHAPRDLSVGDTVKIFLYLDSEDRPIATTQQPKACVGEFAYLRVVANTDVGAFLDWGLDKDLLVPFAEQHRPMEVGKSYLVYIYRDTVDGRIAASSRIDKFIDEEAPNNVKVGQAVDLIIANTTDLGYKAIVNHRYWGVLYKNEVFERLSFGQHKRGYIKRVRPDGKIDLILQGGQESRDRYASLIVAYLRNHDGFAPVNDKSNPELIAELFGMSKKAFKKAIGNLYKQRVISIENDGICLLDM